VDACQGPGQQLAGSWRIEKRVRTAQHNPSLYATYFPYLGTLVRRVNVEFVPSLLFSFLFPSSLLSSFSIQFHSNFLLKNLLLAYTFCLT
jgi:hypothetical protein